MTPSSWPEAGQRAIFDVVGRAAKALGLRHGPVHAECRVNEEGVFILEVAARPIGGLCARALRFQQGVGSLFQFLPEAPAEIEKGSRPLEEILLRHALGESPDRWTREPLASGVMMIPIPRRGVFRGVAGLARDAGACAVEHIDQVRITAQPAQLLPPLPEGASSLGFIFARAADAAAVDRALRAAHAR